MAGWYHSPMTIGPEPKPIRTGATLHSLCITFGILASYKLHVRAYGGASDEDLGNRCIHTGTVQKFINLLDLFLDEYKNTGRCVTMDSAYMGDLLGQVARFVWKMNALGTCQGNRTGAPVKETLKQLDLKPGTYQSVIFQHNTLPLTYACWGDNAIVKTLSNFHSPSVIEGGLKRKRKVETLGKLFEYL